MRKVLFIICMMTAIAASAQTQNEEEEWIPDSIEVDTVAADIVERSDIEEVEWSDRYAVASKDKKCGIIDLKADSLVTDLVFDEAYPAYRKRVFGEYVTYYSIKQGDRLGIVGIFEATNTVTLILAPSQDNQENWEDSVKVYRSLAKEGDTPATQE